MCPEKRILREGFHISNPVESVSPMSRRAGRVCLSVMLSALMISGCAQAGNPTQIGTTEGPSPSGVEAGPLSSPAPNGAAAGQSAPDIEELPGGPTLESTLLAGPPTTEPLTFEPIGQTQAEVLARHAAERQRAYALEVRSDDQYRPTLTAEWAGGTLLARIDSDPTTQAQTARLLEDGQVIFTAPAGFPSPAVPLQGLWTYDDHWALELLMATQDEWKGEVFVDGQLLNDQLGYDEAFGFQLLDGKPFYFYQKGGTIGVNFDGTSTDLGYTRVIHYECCSGSVLNPVKAHAMVAFFAEEAGGWRYVEIGVFNRP